MITQGACPCDASLSKSPLRCIVGLPHLWTCYKNLKVQIGCLKLTSGWMYSLSAVGPIQPLSSSVPFVGMNLKIQVVVILLVLIVSMKNLRTDAEIVQAAKLLLRRKSITMTLAAKVLLIRYRQERHASIPGIGLYYLYNWKIWHHLNRLGVLI